MFNIVDTKNLSHEDKQTISGIVRKYVGLKATMEDINNTDVSRDASYSVGCYDDSSSNESVGIWTSLYIDAVNTKSKDIRNKHTDTLILKGIPSQSRAVIWPGLLTAWTNYSKVISEYKPPGPYTFRARLFRFFQTPILLCCSPKLKITEPKPKLISQPFLDVKNIIQIDRDIQRTFPNLVLFKEKYGDGQKNLFQFLTRVSLKYPEIGYCQGLSSICAVFLIVLPLNQAEEIFDNFLVRNNLINLFDKSLSKLKFIHEIEEYIFNRIIVKRIKSLRKAGIDYKIYTGKWYLSIFTNFGLKFALWVYDLMLYFGFPILVLVSASILVVCDLEELQVGPGVCTMKFDRVVCQLRQFIKKRVLYDLYEMYF
ncbi:Ecotropic viral integration site 5 like protein [Cucumispora dikerogammari]|nr:Ecotropic viral integration site 5 like protein [Cucumispora dikerogammari]